MDAELLVGREILKPMLNSIASTFTTIIEETNGLQSREQAGSIIQRLETVYDQCSQLQKQLVLIFNDNHQAYVLSEREKGSIRDESIQILASQGVVTLASVNDLKKDQYLQELAEVVDELQNDFAGKTVVLVSSPFIWNHLESAYDALEVSYKQHPRSRELLSAQKNCDYLLIRYLSKNIHEYLINNVWPIHNSFPEQAMLS